MQARRSKQISTFGKWMAIYTVFFWVFFVVMPAFFAALFSFSIVLLAIMHPENRLDREAIQPEQIDIILEH